MESRPQPLYGDNALIDLGARRASHLDQLLGPYSRLGFHHPGPVSFYIMAPFVRALGSGQGGYLAAIVVTGVCATCATGLVWRWTGPRAAMWTVSALGAFELCVRVFTLREPWNPYMVVAPMLLLAILTAGALSGRRGAWAWALVAGSYVLQTHISTAPVALALLISPVVPATVRLTRRRPERPSRAAASALVILVLAWMPSIIELFADQPNNVTLLWDFFRTAHPEPSWHSALKAAANAIAIVPFGNETYVNVIVRPRWELAVAIGGLLALACATLAVARARRRSIAGAQVAVAVIIAVVGTLGLKRASGGINAYFATWMAVAPLLAVIAFGVALLGTEVAHRHTPARGARRPRGSVVGLTTLALLTVGAVTTSDLTMTAAADAELAPQVAAGQMAALIEARGVGPVGLDIESADAWPQAAGVALALYRHGRQVLVRPAVWTLYFGGRARPRGALSQEYAFYTAAGAQADGVPPGSVVLATDGVVMAAGPPPATAHPDPLP